MGREKERGEAEEHGRARGKGTMVGGEMEMGGGGGRRKEEGGGGGGGGKRSSLPRVSSEPGTLDVGVPVAYREKVLL